MNVHRLKTKIGVSNKTRLDQIQNYTSVSVAHCVHNVHVCILLFQVLLPWLLRGVIGETGEIWAWHLQVLMKLTDLREDNKHNTNIFARENQLTY